MVNQLYIAITHVSRFTFHATRRYMVNRLYIAINMLVLGTILLAACTSRTTPASTTTLNVTVSILPQKYFVERIGGEYVTVNVMVEPGASPETYEPRPAQLQALSAADAYVRIGVPFEDAWMARIAEANPRMRIVDTAQSIARLPMPTHHGEEETHAGGPGTLDPHTWLSPRLVKVQAQAICASLVELDPQHQAPYQANLARFLADVDTLDAHIRQALAGVENRKFMVFHPAWGYFARDYGLEMIPIEIGGQEPSAAEMAALVTEARAAGIRVIFAQPEFSTRSAETIAREIGGQVLLINPLALDWLDNLRRVADTLAEVLGK